MRTRLTSTGGYRLTIELHERLALSGPGESDISAFGKDHVADEGSHMQNDVARLWNGRLTAAVSLTTKIVDKIENAPEDQVLGSGV